MESFRRHGLGDETLKWIAERDRIEVRLTHITQTVSFGRSRPDNNVRDSSEWSIHGIITHPKFIPVDITFTTDEQQFGGWAYDVLTDLDLGGRKVNLPFVNLWLSDRDGQKATLLHAALREAIMSGQKYAGVRFWKKKGDGLMTPTDKEHGFSYQSSYSILGMVTWLELHAGRLPEWALPTDQRDFSLQALPQNRFDLDGQLE